MINPSGPSSLSSDLQREPLLQPSHENGLLSGARSDVEDGNESSTPSGPLIIAKKIFSMKLVAVMIDFFMAGLCGSSIGVCGRI